MAAAITVTIIIITGSVRTYIKNACMSWVSMQLVDPDHKIKSMDRSISLAPTDGWQEFMKVYEYNNEPRPR